MFFRIQRGLPYETAQTALQHLCDQYAVSRGQVMASDPVQGAYVLDIPDPVVSGMFEAFLVDRSVTFQVHTQRPQQQTRLSGGLSVDEALRLVEGLDRIWSTSGSGLFGTRR